MLQPNSPIPSDPRSLDETMVEKKMKKQLMSRCTKSKVNLSSDIVESNILTKLPVKTLIRFRAVCKSWYSLISSDPWFINMHKNHENNKKKQLFLVDFVTSIVVDDVSCSKIQFSFNQQTRETYNLAIVAGCYNGIVCVYGTISRGPRLHDHNHILFWNPALRTNKIIHKYEETSWSFRPCIGFGYHNQTNDYMVIIFSNGFSKLENIEFYSSTSDSWRGANDHLLIHNYSFIELRGVYVSCDHGGACFWLGRKEGVINGGRDISRQARMISFHMEDQVFKEMMLPPCTSHDHVKDSHAQLFIYKDSLAVLQTQLLKRTISYIWLMKDIHNNSSWTKLCKFDLQRPYVTVRGIIKSQLILHRSGDFGTKDDVKVFDINKSMKMNRRSSSIKDIRRNLTKAVMFWSFSESLISLP